MNGRAQPGHQVDPAPPEGLFQRFEGELGEEIDEESEGEHPGEQGGHLAEGGHNEDEKKRGHIFA